jgi:hypothetical protein
MGNMASSQSTYAFRTGSAPQRSSLSLQVLAVFPDVSDADPGCQLPGSDAGRVAEADHPDKSGKQGEKRRAVVDACRRRRRKFLLSGILAACGLIPVVIGFAWPLRSGDTRPAGPMPGVSVTAVAEPDWNASHSRAVPPNPQAIPETARHGANLRR